MTPRRLALIAAIVGVVLAVLLAALLFAPWPAPPEPPALHTPGPAGIDQGTTP